MSSSRHGDDDDICDRAQRDIWCRGSRRRLRDAHGIKFDALIAVGTANYAYEGARVAVVVQ